MTVQSSQESPLPAQGESHQVLTFSLGEEQFGVDILRVREIRGIAVLGERMLIILNVDELIHRDLDQVVMSEQVIAA